MYSYTFDGETGGLLLNSTPTGLSKEPRPVYAEELTILGFDQFWNYDNQNDTPIMWAESNNYWYRGVLIAKTKGGDLYITDLNYSLSATKMVTFSLEEIRIMSLYLLISSLCAAKTKGYCRSSKTRP